MDIKRSIGSGERNPGPMAHTGGAAAYRRRPRRLRTRAARQRPAEPRVLTSRKIMVHLTPEQDRILQGLAELRGEPDYTVLLRVIDAGFQCGGEGSEVVRRVREVAAEIGALAERLAGLERISDRVLFTACAAYAYAREAALGTARSDDVIAREARAAFQRQQGLAAKSDT
jgi:hypothetical protein